VKHFHRDLLFAAHHMQAAQPLLGSLDMVPDSAVRGEGPRKDAQVRQLADKRVGRGLPDIGRQRPGVGGCQLGFAARPLRLNRRRLEPAMPSGRQSHRAAARFPSRRCRR
jgi:hypothetical protein